MEKANAGSPLAAVRGTGKIRCRVLAGERRARTSSSDGPGSLKTFLTTSRLPSTTRTSSSDGRRRTSSARARPSTSAATISRTCGTRTAKLTCDECRRGLDRKSLEILRESRARVRGQNGAGDDREGLGRRRLRHVADGCDGRQDQGPDDRHRHFRAGDVRPRVEKAPVEGLGSTNREADAGSRNSGTRGTATSTSCISGRRPSSCAGPS